MADPFPIDFDIEIPVKDAFGKISRVRPGGAAKPTSPEAMADDVVKKVALSGTPETQKRFRETVLARINEVRDAMETREELVRTPDKGGLGMPAADADRVLRFIDEVIKGGGAKPAAAPSKPAVVPPRPPTLAAVPAAKPAPAPLPPAKPPAPAAPSALPPPPTRPVVSVPTAPKPAVPHPSAPPKPIVPPPAPIVPSAPAPAPKPPEAAPPIQRDEVYEKLAEEVIRESGVALPPDTRHRLVIALVARLKDVRDSAETKDYITRPVAAGGVGLQAAAAERVLASSNLRFSKITEEMERIEKEKTLAALKREREGEERRVELRTAGEEMARDELFASITAKSKKFPQPPPSVPAVSRPAPAVSAPPSAAFRPPALPPVVPLRPKVLDVAPTQRLVGPIEELRAMTLPDFRKLARDPKEAGLKIRDKINLLQEESFEKRNAGISAWRESEPVKLYAELTANALEGKPVPAQIQERTTAGKPSLTQEEFTAIMELNRILRF